VTEGFLTLTEGFPCFFLSCKANARVKLAKTGHGPHSSTLVVICVVRLLFVLFYVLFVCKCVLPPGDNTIVCKCVLPPGDNTIVCKCVLPPGDNTIAVNKYIIPYHVSGDCVSAAYQTVIHTEYQVPSVV
jgi:hypothetical protein